MPMSQRWRNFYWKLAHNIFPTKENLMKRKIAQNSSCVLYGEKESASHLFLHCEVSKRIWSCSSLGIIISDAPQLEVSTWLKNFFIYLTDKGNSSNPGWALLIATLWAVWIHRNNIIFRKASTNPRGIIEMANVEVRRWYEGFGCRERKDRTYEVGNQEGTRTDMWEHGSQ
ncbi:Prostacyclin synthase [Bienertia sinuspersici]